MVATHVAVGGSSEARHDVAPVPAGRQYECIVTGVDLPWECLPGKTPATGVWVVGRRLDDGAAGEISIKFNGTVYKGSFKRIGRGYVFNWPYGSGVTFTTKSI
ncbi:hypothetical protein [Salmonirosea aquatica]|uniref:Uncharacterized protein n=1 Tax=Salmonirosea aquatica TaxID=2654236 RepID=A0A7C9BMH1_9BACT|nr:hypothetical protein [Cytophagaceae bacterium SJW1-29]